MVEKSLDLRRVLCTHGDVMRDLLDHFARHGLQLRDHRLEKGSIWVLEVTDDTVTGARYRRHRRPPEASPFVHRLVVARTAEATGTPLPWSAADPGDQRRRRRLTRHPCRSPPRWPPTDTTCSWSLPPTTAAVPARRSAGSTAPDRHRSSVATWDELPDLSVHAIDAPPATAVFAACLGAFGDLPDLIVVGHQPRRQHRSPRPALRYRRRHAHRRRVRHPWRRGVRGVEPGTASTTGTPRRVSPPPAVEWAAKPDGGAAGAQHQRAQPPAPRAAGRARGRARAGRRGLGGVGRRVVGRPQDRDQGAAPMRHRVPTSRWCSRATCRSPR